MSPQFRFAILAAVSTKAQAAADKVSIPEQIRQSRSIAHEKGWVESAGPYEIPGASRTKYVNLSDAEQAIPPLRLMLDAAKRREFDLLMVYHLNRFRDLLDQIYRSLGVYGVQLYSVSQPVEPVPPDRYNYETSDTMRIIVTMTQMTSQAETSDIRKRYIVGMPGRVINRGLPAVSPPFGYVLGRTRKSPPEPDPELSQVVVKMKDLYLSGSRLQEIAVWLDQQHIKPPRSDHWYHQTVHGILANPFYYGMVVWGKSHIIRDLRAGTRLRTRKIPQDKIAIVPGQHQPLWDEDTHNQIKALMKIRFNNKTERRHYQFSKLLRCSECGSTLWLQQNGPRNEHRQIWRCHNSMLHPSIPHVVAIENISLELVKAMKAGKLEITRQEEKQNSFDDELRKLRSQRSRLEDAYQIGALNLESFITRTTELDQDINTILARQTDIKNSQRAKEAWTATVGTLEKMLDKFPDYLKERDPAEINRILRAIINYILINHEGIAEIVFN